MLEGLPASMHVSEAVSRGGYDLFREQQWITCCSTALSNLSGQIISKK